MYTLLHIIFAPLLLYLTVIAVITFGLFLLHLSRGAGSIMLLAIGFLVLVAPSMAWLSILIILGLGFIALLHKLAR